MRQMGIGVFALGLISFVSAGFFTGEETGDILWRIGVAAMLVDLVALKLWSSAKGS